MQPLTPACPVSGTLFEAVQLLRPHPKIRPVSGQPTETYSRRSTATPEGDRWSKSSATTAVEPENDAPHLYRSRKQYEVASSRVLGSLGRLDTDIPAASSEASSLASTSLSPRSIALRAKSLFSPRASIAPSTLDGEKEHGTFCRTKTVAKKALRRDKRSVADAASKDVLRSGFYSSSTDHLMEFEDEVEKSIASTISDGLLQIAPLRPVSRFLTQLTISIPDNDEMGALAVPGYSSVEGEEEAEDSDDEALHVAPLRLCSPTLRSALMQDSPAAGASFYYTPSAKTDDNVFSSPYEMSQVDRPVSSFVIKLRKAMEQTSHKGSKTPSIASTASRVENPSLSPRLRHTAVGLLPGSRPHSLWSQYSASEPGTSPPDLNVSKMQVPDEAQKALRVAPSLEEGLCADDLEVFEENALAAVAPIVRGLDPDVVDIRRSQVDETFERQTYTVSNHHRSEHHPAVGTLVSPDAFYLPPSATLDKASSEHLPTVTPATAATEMESSLYGASKRVSTACSSTEVSVVVPTMPFPVLETIVFSAAYGDAECRKLALNLYNEVIGADAPGTGLRWDAQEQHILHRSHTVQELNSLVQCGYLRQDIFETVRQQLFPTGDTELMHNRDFMAYVYRAVDTFALDEDRAKEILQLAIGDDSFAESSLEEEVCFEREPFNPEGFVYDDGTDDEGYGRLSSLPSTVGTFESVKPQPQSGWRSSRFLSKISKMLRSGH